MTAKIIGVIAAGLLITPISVLMIDEVSYLKTRTGDQSVELAAQKVKIDNLEKRVRELEDDLDRIAPHTPVRSP